MLTEKLATLRQNLSLVGLLDIVEEIAARIEKPKTVKVTKPRKKKKK